MILVPVKRLAQAKQRLASVLDQPARTQLAEAMLLDVLEALAPWSDRPDLALVTSDPFALQVADDFDIEVIRDDNNAGETEAIEMATRVCVSRGFSSTLVIPADIPLIQSHEMAAILDAAPREGSVLVASEDGRGTNAVLRSPADLFPLRFGDDSFQPHLNAARDTLKACITLSLPGIALDIDGPSDLRKLTELAGETRSQTLARQWGFAALTSAAHD